MERVGSFEAKTHLPKLLDRVARGERITITRNGVPVAVLVPAGRPERGEVGEAIRRIRELRAEIASSGQPLSYDDIRDAITEGRR